MPFNKLNIPRVTKESDYQRFFDTVRDALDLMMGKKNKYDRMLTVRDLEKLGIDIDKFLNSTKQTPYQL
jgi:hypothetical protein